MVTGEIGDPKKWQKDAVAVIVEKEEVEKEWQDMKTRSLPYAPSLRACMIALAAYGILILFLYGYIGDCLRALWLWIGG